MTNELPASEYDVLLAKQRELVLLREKLALIKENGLAYYRPSEKQHEFHVSMAKDRGVFAGNRFGKSEASAAETAAWFVGERTWYKFKFPIYGIRYHQDGSREKVIVAFHDGHENHPLVRQGIPQHATKQLIITTDWKKVDIVWTNILGDQPGKVWKYLPKNIEINVKRNHEGVIDHIWGSNGASIRFATEQSFIKNPQSSESTDFDRVGVDEPIIEDMWKAVARGLVDRDGQADFTLTSLRERWIYDRFHNEDDSTEFRPGRFAVRATMKDNPYLSDASIARFMENLTSDEIACRIEGLPLELSGLVYKEFDRSTHILKVLPPGWEDWSHPPLDWTTYVAIDVHEQTEQAVLFVCVPPVGKPIIYNEIWKHCVTDELVEEIKLQLTGRSLGFVKADPRAWLEDPTFRVSMAQRFASLGLPIDPASKAKDFGIKNMRSLFKKRVPNLITGVDEPALYVVPTVKRFLREISRYNFDKENKPVDKDDHMMENMYRIFINYPNLVYIPFVSTSTPVPDFDVPMTRFVLTEFADDAAAFERAVGFNN